MKSRLSCLLLITLLMMPLTAPAATPGYRGSCTISFQVQKTLMKDFTGTAACEPFDITVTDNMVNIPVIAVEIATMNTGNNKRDKEMRAMFEHLTFPRITGETEAFTSDRLLTPEGQLVEMPEQLTFALTIRDVTQTITATVTEPVIDPSSINAILAFNLSLSSFGLNPPSFMGIIKVKDDLQVKVNMSIDRSPASTHRPPAQE